MVCVQLTHGIAVIYKSKQSQTGPFCFSYSSKVSVLLSFLAASSRAALSSLSPAIQRDMSQRIMHTCQSHVDHHGAASYIMQVLAHLHVHGVPDGENLCCLCCLPCSIMTVHAEAYLWAPGAFPLEHCYPDLSGWGQYLESHVLQIPSCQHLVHLSFHAHEKTPALGPQLQSRLWWDRFTTDQRRINTHLMKQCILNATVCAAVAGTDQTLTCTEFAAMQDTACS